MLSRYYVGVTHQRPTLTCGLKVLHLVESREDRVWRLLHAVEESFE